MKFSLSKEHLNFFQNHGHIQFEDFLSESQVISLSRAIDLALINKLKLDQNSLSKLSSDQLFLQSRDLWRQNEELRKWTCQQRFASVAADLTCKRTLRLGYDQLLPGYQPNLFKVDVYKQFLDQELSLTAMSCVSNVACGLLISLSDEVKNEQENSDTLDQSVDIFPFQAGDAVYLNAEALIHLKSLYLHPHQRFYLIVYTDSLSWYQSREGDPHTHEWKQELGYSFNEKLADKQHPIVYR